MKYFIETYGCQMNVHDSERMAGLLEQAGYESTAAFSKAFRRLIGEPPAAYRRAAQQM